MKKDLIIGGIILLIITSCAFYLGYIYRQQEVLENAKTVLKQKKLVYEIEDLEIIIYNKR